MKITWLGQAGLLFETRDKTIMVDPYLSDGVQEFEPQNYRRMPIDKSFFKLKPNVIVLTHNHLDHTDKYTLCRYLSENSVVTVLAPCSAWQEVKKFGGLNNNYVLFGSGTTWTEGDIVFRAVKAEHSDEHAIGAVITAENKNYYITGDTLYSEKVFESLPNLNYEAVFLPINGVGNNMNMQDAANFAKRVKARRVVPVHFGMFDRINPEDFNCENKIIPQIYKQIIL